MQDLVQEKASLPTGVPNQTGYMGQAGWTLIPNGGPGKIGDTAQIID